MKRVEKVDYFSPVRVLKGFIEAVTHGLEGEGEQQAVFRMPLSFWSLLLTTSQQTDLSFQSTSPARSPLLGPKSNMAQPCHTA